MRKRIVVMLSLLGAILFGAIVLHEPVVNAAAAVLNMVVVGPVDAGGNVLVRSVDVPAPSQPFVRVLQCQFDLFGSCTASVDIPDGQRLVIETVSLLATVPIPATVDLFRVFTRVGSDQGFAAIPVVSAGSSSGNNHFAVTQQVRMYSDQSIEAFANARGVATGSTAFMAVNGHLVPRP